MLGYNALVRGNKGILNALNSFAHDVHAYFVTGARVSVDGQISGNVLPLKKAPKPCRSEPWMMGTAMM